MTRFHPLRSWLLAPLVYLAALVLLLEEWFWDVGGRVASAIGAWPPLKALEERVRNLPPYAALAAFVLPGLLLIPVKVLALIAIAHGHAASGLATLVVAKLGGAAVVARLYVLTLPSLLALAWFARLHSWFMALKDRYIARLRASHLYRQARRLLNAARRGVRRLRRRLWPRTRPDSRHAGGSMRILRRFVARWRARRRKTTETEHR